MNESAPAPLLIANLRALATRSPDLVQRLVAPCGSEHVVLEGARAPCLRHGHEELRLALESSEVQRCLANAPRDAERVSLFGLGLGELAAAWLAGSPARSLVVFERDPLLVRMALERHDFQEPLADGRLQLALAADLVHHAGLLPDEPWLLHPVLRTVYTHEHALITAPAPVAAPRAAIAVGTLFVDDLTDALRARGYAVWPLELTRWSEEELSHTLSTLRPELVVAVNYTTGLAEFCRDHAVPLVVWEVDPCTDRRVALEGSPGAARIFTYRQANAERFAEAGFEQVAHLPLAANLRRRRPLELGAAERANYAAPLAFVGASMLTQASDYRAQLVADVARFYGCGASDAEARIEGLLEIQRSEFRRWAIPTYARDPARLGDFLLDSEERGTQTDPLMLLGEIAAAEKRLTYLRALAPLGLDVWGDAGFKVLEEQGARYRGPAGHRQELTRIYNAAGAVIDIDRVYQPDIITMRVFDVLACGGRVLSQRTRQIEELLLNAQGLVLYGSLEDLVAKARATLAEPPAIAPSLDFEHTVDARLAHMLG